MREPKDVLAELSDCAKRVTTSSLDGGRRAFDAALAAAFAKSYEFCRFAHGEHGSVEPFFGTGALRSICEDLIALKFIHGMDVHDRSPFVMALSMFEQFRSADAQESFFTHERKSQPILSTKLIQEVGQRSEQELKSYKAKYGWQSRNLMPSTFQMAKHVGLDTLYRYLYHATSEWVHFKPRVLLRMGWGTSNAEDAEFQFSTRNFHLYYFEFNRFYSVYLFILFIDTFETELSTSDDAVALVAELREFVDEYLRWPELVTFEEMNTKGPSEIIRLLAHAARKYQREQTDSSADNE
jgi:hypothetical protein